MCVGQQRSYGIYAHLCVYVQHSQKRVLAAMRAFGKCAGEKQPFSRFVGSRRCCIVVGEGGMLHL